MKRKVIIGIMSLTILPLTSLQSQAQKSVNQDTSMTVQGDKTFKITLPSNPTTGYGWIVRNLPANIALTGMDYNQSQDCKGAMGCGGQETLYFKPVNAGTGKLFLQYARPFEPLPKEGKTITITVKSAPKP